LVKESNSKYQEKTLVKRNFLHDVIFLDLSANYVTMMKMKRSFVHFLVIFTLALNLYSLAAFAKPCAMTMDSRISEKVMTDSAMASMPCHQSKQDKSPSNTMPHCKGVCFCKHVALNQTPILGDHVAITAPPVFKQPRLIAQDSLSDAPQATPKRPPRALS